MLQKTILICSRPSVPRYFAASAGYRISVAFHLKSPSQPSQSPFLHRAFSTCQNTRLSAPSNIEMATEQQNAKVTLYWSVQSEPMDCPVLPNGFTLGSEPFWE